MKIPPVFQKEIEELRAMGVLDDPSTKAALSRAVVSAVASAKAAANPSEAQLGDLAGRLSKRLGRPVSAIDAAAMVHHFRNEPKRDTTPPEGSSGKRSAE